MPRHLVAVTVGAVSLAVGLTVGLLLRPVSADWFEAVGTWVGVVVSTAAVVLAVLVFRSDDFMRRMSLARETQREEAAAREAARREDELGNSVDCLIRFASGVQGHDGSMVAQHLYISVQNNADDRTATAVWVRFAPLFGDEPRLLAQAVRAGDTFNGGMLALPKPLNLPAGNASLEGQAEFRYTIAGVNWVRINGQPAVRDLPSRRDV